MADEIPDEEKTGAPERASNAQKDGEEDVSGHRLLNETGDDRSSRAPEKALNAKDEGEDDVSGHKLSN
ncbi:MAG TPA: hypothetical protein VII79_09045 [Candidatus Dormibacteraeota bacterium]|jgi:hypothetical protein